MLSVFDTIKVCTSYKISGVQTSDFPSETDAPIEPVYTEFPGWKQDLCGLTDEAALPKAFNDYVAFIESATGVRVSIISLGPDRDTLIER